VNIKRYSGGINPFSTIIPTWKPKP